MADSTVRILFLGNAGSALRSTRLIESSFRSIGRTARIAGTAVAAGLGTAIVSATNAAVDFDRSMRNVNSIAKLSERQFQSLEKQVLALAKTTGQAPKVLADGLYDIVSSGFKANDAVKILGVSAKAATAGMTDTATAAKAVTAILNGYRLGADKAANVSSLLFQEVNLGVNTFEELAQNLGDTVPLASALKIPFAEVAAGLAEVTLHGTSMAEASTQMARVMAALIKPTDSLQQEFEKLGFANGQAAVEALGFTGVIGALSKEAGGNQQQLAEWLGDIRGIRGVLNLSGRNLDHYRGLVKNLSRAFRDGGADTAAFNEQSKSISVQWQKAKAALTAAAIPLGQVFFPALQSAAGAAQNLAEWLERLSRQKTVDAKVRFTVAGLKDLGSALGELLLGRKGRTVPVKIEGGRIEWKLVGYRQGLLSQIGDQLDDAFSEQAMFGSQGRRVRVPIEGGRFEWKIVGAREGWLNALERELEQGTQQLDFSRIGRVLARTGSGLIQVAGVLAVALARLIGQAIRDINWSQVGGEIAKGMVKALQNIGPAVDDEVKRTINDKFGSLGPRISDALGRTLDLIPQTAGVSKLGRIFSPLEDSADAAERRTGSMFSAIIGKAQQAVPPIASVGTAIKDLPRTHDIQFRDNADEAMRRIEQIRARIFSLPTTHTTTIAIQEHISLAQRRQHGGFIHGVGSRDTVPALLTPGELVLNRRQQNMLGGPRFLARLFGFTGREGPGFARGGIAGGLHPRSPDEFDTQYGLLQRQFGLPRSEAGEEYGPHELARLIGNRRGLIRAIHREQRRLRRRDRSLAADERHADKDELQSIRTDRRDIRRQLRDIPYQLRAARLDIAELRQSRVAAAAGPNVEDLLAQIGQLKLALGIQGAQSQVLGQFQHGVRFVPKTGLALLHRGEQVVSAPDVARRTMGGDGATVPPLHVEMHFANGMEWLERFVTVKVRTAKNADYFNRQIGLRADGRRRTGLAFAR